MNKQETAEAILVMQAWIDGEEIEGRFKDRDKNDWLRLDKCEFIIWDFDRSEYRIKPSPREFWMNTYTWEVLEGEPSGNNPNWVHVREVL